MSASSDSSANDGSGNRKKIAQSLNIEAGVKDKGAGPQKSRGGGAGRKRVNSEPTASRFEHSQSPPPSVPDQVPPEMMGVVTHLTFSETYVSGQCRECAGFLVLKHTGQDNLDTLHVCMTCMLVCGLPALC